MSLKDELVIRKVSKTAMSEKERLGNTPNEVLCIVNRWTGNFLKACGSTVPNRECSKFILSVCCRLVNAKAEMLLTETFTKFTEPIRPLKV